MLEGEETANVHPHSHHAIQVTFRLKGWFEINVGREKLAGPVAAIGSDTQHSFRASGAVAFLFIAPESLVGAAIKNVLFEDQSWAGITQGPLAEALVTLRECFERGAPEVELQCVGQAVLNALQPTELPRMPDPRVLAMIDYAKRNLDDRISLLAAARDVGLSPSRARHLFVAQTGLPFKTYVLWLRIEMAVALYASGSSLTAAAHEGGFADSAHFSRTFRTTFGLAAMGLRLHHE
ncbi:helix-turn-helix domain-containing protein [Tsuneonella sp. HG249]